MQPARISTGKIMKRLLLVVWVIFVVAYVARMIQAGERESIVTVTSQFVDIRSAHGVRIPIDAITEIALRDDMPKIGRKVRGYNSFSCVKKGEFKLKDMGVGRIYIFSKEGPYLHVFAGDQVVIIALKDPGRTRQLYRQIVSQRQQE